MIVLKPKDRTMTKACYKRLHRFMRYQHRQMEPTIEAALIRVMMEGKAFIRVSSEGAELVDP